MAANRYELPAQQENTQTYTPIPMGKIMFAAKSIQDKEDQANVLKNSLLQEHVNAIPQHEQFRQQFLSGVHNKIGEAIKKYQSNGDSFGFNNDIQTIANGFSTSPLRQELENSYKQWGETEKYANEQKDNYDKMYDPRTSFTGVTGNGGIAPYRHQQFKQKEDYINPTKELMDGIKDDESMRKYIAGVDKYGNTTYVTEKAKQLALGKVRSVAAANADSFINSKGGSYYLDKEFGQSVNYNTLDNTNAHHKVNVITGFNKDGSPIKEEQNLTDKELAHYIATEHLTDYAKKQMHLDSELQVDKKMGSKWQYGLQQDEAAGLTTPTHTTEAAANPFNGQKIPLDDNGNVADTEGKYEKRNGKYYKYISPDGKETSFHDLVESGNKMSQGKDMYGAITEGHYKPVEVTPDKIIGENRDYLDKVISSYKENGVNIGYKEAAQLHNQAIEQNANRPLQVKDLSPNTQKGYDSTILGGKGLEKLQDKQIFEIQGSGKSDGGVKSLDDIKNEYKVSKDNPVIESHVVGRIEHNPYFPGGYQVAFTTKDGKSHNIGVSGNDLETGFFTRLHKAASASYTGKDTSFDDPQAGGLKLENGLANPNGAKYITSTIPTPQGFKTQVHIQTYERDNKGNVIYKGGFPLIKSDTESLDEFKNNELNYFHKRFGDRYLGVDTINSKDEKEDTTQDE